LRQGAGFEKNLCPFQACLMMSLTARDTGAFVKALLKPPAPSKKLKRAAERYKEIMG
jgi:uncharacterized protein (DUF1778 family)